MTGSASARWRVGALLVMAALLTLTACTSDTTTGHGTAATSGKRAGAASGARPAAPAKPRITGLTAAWTWQPFGPAVKNPLFTRLNALQQDARRIYAMGELAAPGDLTAHPTRVLAADLRTGRQLWAVTLPGANTQLVVLPGVVVVATEAGTAYGLDAATGRTRWALHHLGTSDVTPMATTGDLLFATLDLGSFSGIVRLDPATGRVLARTSAVLDFADLTAGGGVLLTEDGDHVTAFGPDLRTRRWLAKGEGTTSDIRGAVVGSVFVELRNEINGKAAMRGLDLSTGRVLWTTTVPFEDELATPVSFADGLVFIDHHDVMTAFDPAHGERVVWHTRAGIAGWVGAAPAAGNVLACGTGLVSAESSDAALYELTDLKSRGFGQDGCIGPPLAAAPVAATAGTPALPGIVVVAAPTAVYGFAATSTNAPAPAPDPLGRWGPVNPAQCGLDAAVTRRALTRAFGGAWALDAADATHDCEWRSGGLTPVLTAQTVPLADLAAARTYLDRRNADGGCADAAGRGGRIGAVPLSGVPGAIGGCYVTGYSDNFGTETDAVSGVSTRSGRYFAVAVLGFSYGKVLAAKGPQRMATLLRTLYA